VYLSIAYKEVVSIFFLALKCLDVDEEQDSHRFDWLVEPARFHLWSVRGHLFWDTPRVCLHFYALISFLLDEQSRQICSS